MMKKALKEYCKRVRLSGKWAKKRWKEMTVLTVFYALCVAALYSWWWYYDDMKAYVKGKLSK